MNTKQTPTWQGLDFARFVCVLFMVFIHSIFWLIAYDGVYLNTENFLVPIINFFHIVGAFPLCIPATAGASLRLHFSPYLKQYSLKNYSLLYILKTSVFLILVGYFTQFLTWGTESIIWDVFFFICFSYLIISLLLKYTNLFVLISVAMLVLGLTSTMRQLLDGNNMAWALTLVGDPNQLFFWPIFPWFSTIVFGMVCADILLRSKKSQNFGSLAFIAGTIIALAAYYTTDSLFELGNTRVWSESIFKPDLASLFFVLGTFLILIGLGEIIGSKCTFKKYGIINCFSKGILWIAIFHQVIGINLVWWIIGTKHLAFFALAFPALMLLLSWGIGAISVWLSLHSVTINLRKSVQS